MDTDKQAQKGESIALCMIVKDEEDNLPRCLQSIQGLVSEINLVDTGSQDATIRIARDFGAIVQAVPWTDDFSSSRNASLDMAKADWILVLDADEAISSDAIPLIRAAVKKNCIAFTLPTRNYTDDSDSADFTQNDGSYAPAAEYRGWVESRKVRLFRNLPEIRFEGRLHELVEPAIRQIGGRIEFLDIPIHHFGYARSEKALRPKLERMKTLAQAKCRDDAADYKAFYELGVIQARLDELEDAKKSFRRAVELKNDFSLSHYDLGVVLSRCGELAEAADEYRIAAQLDTSSFDASYNLAVSLQKLRREQEALAVYKRLLNKYPEDKKVWNNLGALYASMGRLKEAEDAFKKALKAAPDFAAAKVNLDKLKLASSRPECEKSKTPTLGLLMIVRNEYENLRELLPVMQAHFDEIVVVDTGSEDGTVELAKSFTEKVFSISWTDDFSAARNFALGKAETDWVFWLDADDRLSPEHSLILRKYLNRENKAYLSKIVSGGAEFLQLRLFPRAKGIEWEGSVHEQILPSLKQSGFQFEALPDVAVYHQGYDNPEVAKQKALRNVRMLERELKERPGDANILHHLGQAYGMLGMPERAVEVLERYTGWKPVPPDFPRTEPNFPDGAPDEFLLHSLNMLVQDYFLLRKPEKAVKCAQRVLELDPDNRLVKYLLGEIFYRCGRVQEAIDWLRAFCNAECTPGLIPVPWKMLRANAHNYLGLAYAKTGDRTHAAEAFKKAIEEGARIEADKNLASLYLEEGKPQAAAEVFRAALQKQNNDPQLWINYGVALARIQDFQGASQAFQKALSFDPQNETAKRNLEQLQNLHSSSKKIAKPFTLSTCLIVRDEENSIRQAIESVKPVSDEIVVVDTGSTDATVEIAQACGAIVRRIQWNHDFAEARNTALELATSDWILSLDADEVLAGADLPKIAALEPDADVWGYSMTSRNYSQDRRIVGWQPSSPSDKDARNIDGWFPSKKVRLFRNLPEIRFEGCVHECVEPSILRANKRIEFLDVPVHHYGYISGRDEKQRYYLDLAQRKADEHPADPRAQYELGIQHLDVGNYHEAERALGRAFEQDRRNELAALNLAIAKIYLDKLEQAQELLEKMTSLHPKSACAYYNLAVVLEKRGRLDEAEQHYQNSAALDPRDANPLAKLGYLKAAKGELEVARPLLREALALDPNHPVARRNLEYVDANLESRNLSQCDLTLNMIVKDEEHNLRENLGPVAGLFDEIVIVDTGSADATAAVAASLGAKVVSHPWNNNFADARNAALRHSTGKWVFWLDADDRIEPKAVQTLRKFIARGIPCGVFFPLKSKIGQNATVVNYALRLFPNRPGLKWEGAVHEQIVPSLQSESIKLVNCPDFTITHVGYEKDEEVLQKNLRNLKLLSAELANRPEDPYVLFSLAQAFLYCGQIEAAARWLCELWRLHDKVNMETCRDVFWLAAVVLSDVATSSGNLVQAEQWLKQAVKLAPENWLAYFLLGERKLMAGDMDAASSFLHRARELGVTPTILPLDIGEMKEKLAHYLDVLNQNLASTLP